MYASGGFARIAENPFGVRGDGKAAGAAGFVLQREAGNLDGIVGRHELQEIADDAVRGVLEAAVALAVACDVDGSFVANGQRRGRPDFAGAFVADIESFAGRIDDVIVGPGRELIFVAVLRPCKAGAGFGDQETEVWIRDDVDPRLGVRRPSLRHGHVLAAVFREAAKAVGKLQELAAASCTSWRLLGAQGFGCYAGERLRIAECEALVRRASRGG